ncbi:undecaprenyl-diphosphatase [Microbacterium terrae]|uniref:Undecaprenyl-diphosphatase n=1 Tax=Microbacterium terrae TaxID=69369 RepID=A0A0M2H1U3_9MICO|nr:undecaprenyl-diphosphate phosphatase [Microbacterium terrae]KJL38043.1 Undecaprenyl-diphosphatase [Microbacterium terrae]MBP1077455.1 undecaprenyl-diphosphatase [Microbacterium terrae]GLJ99062.1 undecaprenyl-diphosphatase 2 [Microbacterium terrae]
MLLEAIILGFVQGLTEFLPVSSSAHLRILGEFLPSAQDPGAAFTAITQLGTEAAVVLFFWRDIVRIVGSWGKSLVGRVPRNDPDAKMGWLIIIGSIPIVVLGLLFQDQIETTFRSLWLVAAMLIFFGVLLGIADAVGAKRRKLQDITVGHGVIYGFAQALALIPGVSRSGGTITAGLFLGYERAAAARYAFLLAIPAVFGSGFYQLFKSWDEPGVFTLGETAVATGVAFVVALGVIAFFMSWISKHSFLPFVVYRVAVGSILLVLLATGAVSAY